MTADLVPVLLAVAILALPVLLARLLSSRSRGADRQSCARVPVPSAAAATGREAANDALTLEAEVKTLIAQGKKIEAIRLMRETKGLTLEAAKDSVEAIERHGRPTLGEMGMMSAVRLAQQLGRDVHDLVASGQKTEAIRRVRDQTGLGLKEARELVDRLG